MFNFKNLLQVYSENLPKSFFFCLLGILIFSSDALAVSHPCERAAKNLRGDLNLVQNRGGLWSLMEQRGLKDNSVIGMQGDSKLARLAGHFETLCESEKKPTKQLFEKIQSLYGEARTIFNPRSSGEQITQSITELNTKLDKLIASFK